MKRFVGIALLCLLFMAYADARVGGGQGFSGGGGGGDGGEAELLIDIFILLVHLCIDYPKIGLPLLAIFLVLVVLRFLYKASRSGRKLVENHSVTKAPPARRARSRAKLEEVDGGFSETVFLDYAALVHRRAVAAGRDFSQLGPFVGEALQGQLKRFSSVTEVVIGGVTLEAAEVGSPQAIEVDFIALYRGERTELVQSRWRFERAAGVLSPAPEQMLSLACPSCGNPAETTKMGTCVSCGIANTQGQLQWQAVSLTVRSAGAPPSPTLAMSKGGKEQSAKEPTQRQPQLAVQLRRLVGRHPDFSKQDFKIRVAHVYYELQSAWSEDQWSRARPFVTDLLYQQLRFWVDDYQRQGLRNRLEDVQLGNVQIVKVQVDAWYETLTVRIFGSMRDSVVDANGKVVAGNAKSPRLFSEYWTFLRAAGSGGDSGDPAACPSCGAPLDNVGSNGVCGYCDAKLSSGRHDWVLARIEQPEAYRG